MTKTSYKKIYGAIVVLYLCFSFHGSYKILIAAVALVFHEDYDLSQLEEVEIRRYLQGYFRKFDAYLSPDDLYIKRELKSEYFCGAGRVFIWVPLQMTLPFFGKRIYEWCIAVN